MSATLRARLVEAEAENDRLRDLAASLQSDLEDATVGIFFIIIFFFVPVPLFSFCLQLTPSPSASPPALCRRGHTCRPGL